MSQISRTKLARAYVALVAKHPQAILIRALAAAVIEYQLTNQIDLLLRDIEQELLRTHQLLEAEVVSAHPLDKQVRTALKGLLRQTTGAQTINLEQRLDKKLLGGLIATTAGLELDLSIKSQLNKLQAQEI